jgi:hypothetical protein
MKEISMDFYFFSETFEIGQLIQARDRHTERITPIRINRDERNNSFKYTSNKFKSRRRNIKSTGIVT